MVACDGILYDASPITIPDLAPGDHLIVVEKPGFREARRTVTLSPASRKSAIELKLEPLLGLVLVQTTPPGAEVRIDGVDRGRTPLLLTDLPLGKYRMTLAAPGFTPKQVEVAIENRTPQIVAFDLASDSARLSFTSTPSGASVAVNGLNKGVTPCEVDQLPTGENTIVITLPGYARFEQKVRLQAGAAQRIEAALTPLPASFAIFSTPPGAKVYIDDQLAGQTPLTLDTVAPGMRVVRIEAAGYEPMTRSVELKAHERHVEEFALARIAGTLEVITDQAETRVAIDGADKGTLVSAGGGRPVEPLRIELPAGEHRLTLSKKGYNTIEKTIRIARDEVQSVREVMIRRFVPDTMIRLHGDDIITGCINRKLPNGDIELETRAGIFRTVKAGEIVSVEPLIEERK